MIIQPFSSDTPLLPWGPPSPKGGKIILPRVPRIVPATRVPRNIRPEYEHWVEFERWQMSISITALTPGVNSSTDGDSFVQSADITPSTGALLVICGNGEVASNPDLRAATLSWSGTGSPTLTSIRSRQWDSAATPTRRMEAWRHGPVSGLGTGRFTMDFGVGTDFTGGELHVIQVIGCKTTGSNAADAIVQSAAGVNDSTATSGPSITLAAFADAVNNYTLAFIGHNTNENSTVGTGFTALINGAGHASPVSSLLSQYKAGEVLAPSASWATNGRAAGIAMELAMDTGQSVVPLIVRHLMQQGIM